MRTSLHNIPSRSFTLFEFFEYVILLKCILMQDLRTNTDNMWDPGESFLRGSRRLRVSAHVNRGLGYNVEEICWAGTTTLRRAAVAHRRAPLVTTRVSVVIWLSAVFPAYSRCNYLLSCTLSCNAIIRRCDSEPIWRKDPTSLSWR